MAPIAGLLMLAYMQVHVKVVNRLMHALISVQIDQCRMQMQHVGYVLYRALVIGVLQVPSDWQ